MRKKLTAILENTILWDKKVNVLQVTDTTEKTMKIRALMSAKDSGTAWDLRCLVREQMISYLQKDQLEHLPKFRAEMEEK